MEDFLPASVAAAFRPLRKRLLFQNEYVQMVLAGLNGGERICGFRTDVPILIISVYGAVNVLAGRLDIELVEGEDLRIEPGQTYAFRASEESDLLFFIPSIKQKAANDSLSTLERALLTSRNATDRQQALALLAH